jgi:hypothetical protein
MRKIIIFLFLLFTIQSLDAQVIEGHVLTRNGKHKDAVPYAQAQWKGASDGILADSTGHFELEVSPNTDTLIISAIGFESDTFIAKAGHRDFLLRTVISLEGVEVTKKLKASYLSTINVQQEEIISSKTMLKAACCNLAESFENNPSIEANFTDAVSGVKQIRLLGLQGTYTQMMIENIPDLRGLSGNYGMSYIPGTWIESIQVSKGSGTVVNGYESMTGQINLELAKPFRAEKLYFNAYGDNMGRGELNLNLSHKINPKWSTILLTHADGLFIKNDDNGDGFLDSPLGEQYSISNRWHYESGKRLESQLGVNALWNSRLGGQVRFDPEKDKGTMNAYGYGSQTRRLEAYAKAGVVFPEKPYRSIGSQYQFVHHGQDAYFGLKNYQGEENSLYANFIYQDIIRNTNHQFKTGLSVLYDHYNEQFMDSLSKRTELVPGIFGEYTFNHTEHFNVQAGLRVDYHNIFGWMLTPRLHARYAITHNTIVRASVGKGYRTPNVWVENAGLWLSSRKIVYLQRPEQEKSWNTGISLLQNFKLHDREGHLSADYYYTAFQNQYIADVDADPHKIFFYNLNGPAFAQSWQAEAGYEVLKGWDLLLAYKYNKVEVTQLNGLQLKSLTPVSRALFTTTYATKFEKWMFDATLARYGQSRLPGEPDSWSPAWYMANFQVTRNFKKWSVYAGSENLLNYMQMHPIMSAEDPFGPHFDASMIWGPLEGRKIYAGLRYKIK